MATTPGSSSAKRRVVRGAIGGLEYPLETGFKKLVPKQGQIVRRVCSGLKAAPCVGDKRVRVKATDPAVESGMAVQSVLVSAELVTSALAASTIAL